MTILCNFHKALFIHNQHNIIISKTHSRHYKPNFLFLTVRIKLIKFILGGSFTMRVDLASLLGDTWYAIYASITSNVNTVGLYSTIGYFRTLPRQPEPILNLRGEGLSRSTIELIWQPPSRPNGDITTYLIYYTPMEDRLPVNNSKILCLMKGKYNEINSSKILSLFRSWVFRSNCS